MWPYVSISPSSSPPSSPHPTVADPVAGPTLSSHLFHYTSDANFHIPPDATQISSLGSPPVKFRQLHSPLNSAQLWLIPQVTNPSVAIASSCQSTREMCVSPKRNLTNKLTSDQSVCHPRIVIMPRSDNSISIKRSRQYRGKGVALAKDQGL